MHRNLVMREIRANLSQYCPKQIVKEVVLHKASTSTSYSPLHTRSEEFSPLRFLRMTYSDTLPSSCRNSLMMLPDGHRQEERMP